MSGLVTLTGVDHVSPDTLNKDGTNPISLLGFSPATK